MKLNKEKVVRVNLKLPLTIHSAAKAEAMRGKQTLQAFVVGGVLRLLPRFNNKSKGVAP